MIKSFIQPAPAINIRDAQQADPSISRLFNLKVNNKPKPSARQFRKEPYFRKMLRHYDRLFIHDGILVRAIGKSRLHPHYVIVIPPTLITTVMQTFNSFNLAEPHY